MINEEIGIEEQLQKELSRLKKAIDYIEQAERTVQQAEHLNAVNLSQYNEMLKSNDVFRVDIKSRISDLENESQQVTNDMKELLVKYTDLVKEIQKPKDSISPKQVDEKIHDLEKKQDLIKSNLNNKILEVRKKVKEIPAEKIDKRILELERNQKLTESSFNNEKIELQAKIDELVKSNNRSHLLIGVLFIFCILTLMIALIK